MAMDVPVTTSALIAINPVTQNRSWMINMEISSKTKLKEMLTRHEGFRAKPYRCTSGKLTIGVGRNIEDVGITEAEAKLLLNNDINNCELQLEKNFSWYQSLNDPRKCAMIDLCFNLGITKLKTFKKFLLAMESCKYRTAQDELLNSNYAKQVKQRAEEIAHMICYGEWL